MYVKERFIRQTGSQKRKFSFFLFDQWTSKLAADSTLLPVAVSARTTASRSKPMPINSVIDCSSGGAACWVCGRNRIPPLLLLLLFKGLFPSLAVLFSRRSAPGFNGACSCELFRRRGVTSRPGLLLFGITPTEKAKNDANFEKNLSIRYVQLFSENTTPSRVVPTRRLLGNVKVEERSLNFICAYH